MTWIESGERKVTEVVEGTADEKEGREGGGEGKGGEERRGSMLT